MTDFPYEHIKESQPALYAMLYEYWAQHGTMPINDIITFGCERPTEIRGQDEA